MPTVHLSIPYDTFPSGYLLIQNASGVRSQIVDLQATAQSSFAVKVMEVYPTGNPPDINYTSTRTMVETFTNSEPIRKAQISCDSYCGSTVNVAASGLCELIVTYRNLDKPLSSWDGFNFGLENGKLY